MKKYINVKEDNIHFFLKEANNFNNLTREEEKRQITKAQNGDDKSREVVINSNLNFVISVAKEFQGNGNSIGDLINDGNEGIVKALSRFDNTKGIKFISYAVWWVRQSIIQGINDNSRLIRIPVNMISELRLINKKIIEFEKKFHRLPHLGENIGDNEKEITFGELKHNVIESLSKPINENGDELGDLMVSENTPIDIDEPLVKKELRSLLSKLDEREGKIIEMYFGLSGNYEAMKLGEIGDVLAITKERVRQIKENALRKLRFHSINLISIMNN